MEFVAHVGDRKITLRGETLVDAIENGMSGLAQSSGLGNVAGIAYDSASVRWEDGILGGKGGAVLSITAHGSDNLVNYDPYEDKPQTKTVRIEAAKENVPAEPYAFEFVEEKPEEIDVFAPIDDICNQIGYYFAICDEIALNHAKVPIGSNGLQLVDKLQLEYPNSIVANPVRFIELVQQRVRRSLPKNDAETQKLLNRADELALQLLDVDVQILRKAMKDPSSMWWHINLYVYFRQQNRITALAYYRKKAGLSGKQLADMVGISDRQLRNYERVRGGSSLGDAKHIVVENLAKALNVKPKNLVKDGYAILIDERTGKEV